MLPHYPALLFLLVTSGGADHPPPPPPPPSWKELSWSPPSPGEEVVSSSDKHEQNIPSGSRSSTAPEIEAADEVLLAVGDAQSTPPSEDRYVSCLLVRRLSRMSGGRDQKSTASAGATRSKTVSTPTISSKSIEPQALRTASIPSIPSEMNKRYPMIIKSKQRYRRSMNMSADKTRTINLINEASQLDLPYGYDKNHHISCKRCPEGINRGFLANDTSGAANLQMTKTAHSKQAISSKANVQHLKEIGSPFFPRNFLFPSEATSNSSSGNGVTLREHRSTVYYVRGSLLSSKASVNSIISAFSQGVPRGSESHEKILPIGSNMSEPTFRDVSNNLFSGGVSPKEQRGEHSPPHHKAVTDVKGTDLAHLRQKTGEVTAVFSRHSSSASSPASRVPEPHMLRALQRTRSSYRSSMCENNFSGNEEFSDAHVNNCSALTSKFTEDIQAPTLKDKLENWKAKSIKVRQIKTNPRISGVNSKISNDSLFWVDREAGESEEVSRASKKRGAKEKKKNEFVLFKGRTSWGHSNMAVRQEEDRESRRKDVKTNRVIRSVTARCRGTGNVACAAEDLSENVVTNKLDAISDRGRNNAGEPFRFRNENSPGIPQTYPLKRISNEKTTETADLRTRMGTISPPSMEDVPVVRHRRKRWSISPWELKGTQRNRLRNHTTALPSKYSTIFTKNFPKIFSNYHSGTMNKRNYLSVSDERPQQPVGDVTSEVQRAPAHGLAADMKQDRKPGRPSSAHANRSSARAKGGNKHTRGERTFIKSPQQRHARSRNRAKRKVPAREVWALAGDLTLLPCDLSVRLPKDSVQMVMWLREGTHTPLFSVDYREQAGGQPQVWRDSTASTARRAYLHLAGNDVGVADGTAQAVIGTHVAAMGFGDDVGTTFSDGTSPRGFGIDDFDALGNDLEVDERQTSSEGNLDDDDDDDESVGLVVRDVELNDSAVFRCRVDFLLSPTRNTRVNLTVVVPPMRVGVRWWMGELGDSVIDNQVGPFREGDSPTLVCFTRDAWPPPRVVWFEEDVLVDDTYATDAMNEAVENAMTLGHLTRAHHRRRFTCVAANSNLTRPIAATVHIQMALDVLSVEMDKVDVLSAGVQAEVKCTAWGSSPPPTITWSLAGTLLPSAKPWVSDDGNRSVSMVSFTPQARHDGTQLDCSAHNPVIVGESPHLHPPADHRHSTVLTVNYAPLVSVKLGRNLVPTNIKEGDDLYFECEATAKPPPHKVTWSHNGVQLQSAERVLVTNMTLVLQKVSRANAGSYICHATNSEGSAASQPIPLDVKYAPVCATEKASQHSVAKHENARISCNVLANPPVVLFRWAFNNTAEAVSVPEDRYVVKGTESVVNYTPVTELDYGTLLCWATNNIGQQANPCVFQIVAAGKPDPPHNCRAYDVTISSLQVSCLPGDDGGLGQTFILKVLEANGDNKEVVVVNRESASFSVANLRPATAYRLHVTATNAKGESRPAELSAYTVALNHPQHETPAEPTRGRESGAEVAVGVLVGAVLACLPVAIAVVVMGVRTCMRLRAAGRGRGKAGEKEALKMEAGTTGRPLLTGQGTPGSVGGGSAETGSDITTITGGVALSTTTMPPTPSSGGCHRHFQHAVPRKPPLQPRQTSTSGGSAGPYRHHSSLETDPLWSAGGEIRRGQRALGNYSSAPGSLRPGLPNLLSGVPACGPAVPPSGAGTPATKT
ncbi:uncharacterized protein [Procambarus clarkii]|uniref:uncharacterized protein isoform X2 n=1 Tax=Procambarus clarkii TaxID=6728 RepID=UPI0037423297